MKAIHIQDKFSKFNKHWHPHQIAVVDDMQVILAKLKGEFVWHKHDDEDELFQVIKGPVAIAGSIPRLSKTIGTKVPTSAATTITDIIDTAIAMLSVVSWPIIKPKSITSNANANPFMRLNPTSFSKRLSKLPFTLSFAKPCTIMALD